MKSRSCFSPRGGHASNSRWQIAFIAASLLTPGVVWAATPPLAFNDGTILVGDGTTIRNGSLFIMNGRVMSVGPSTGAPFMGRPIDLSGKYITPGLIDLQSTLTLSEPTTGGVVNAQAADAFNLFDTDSIKAAWRAGITTVVLTPRSEGAAGLGAIIRLRPAAPLEDRVLSDEAGLCVAVGADASARPFLRVQTVESIRQQLRTAKEYRLARQDYEKALEEYEEKLAERAKKQSEKKKQDDQQKAAAEDKDKQKNADQKENGDELKKPDEPAKSREAETWLRVLDGELHLRVEAHAPADILNVLDLAREFPFALILEGATGAHAVADAIAERNVPVVYCPSRSALRYGAKARPAACVSTPAALQTAGVETYFGSGWLPPRSTPHLILQVARAAGHGYDADQAIQTLTGSAAELIGVDDEIGTLKKGRRADLVIWSAHPLSPGAQVESVFIDGQLVYDAQEESNP